MICMCLLIERFQRIIILRKVRGHGNIFDSDSAVCSWFCGVVYTTKSHLAVWCTVRSQTLRRDAHCGVMKTKSLEKLRGGMHTAESDSGVSSTPQSQSQRCDAHYGFWLHSVIYCTPRSFLKTLLKKGCTQIILKKIGNNFCLFLRMSKVTPFKKLLWANLDGKFHTENTPKTIKSGNKRKSGGFCLVCYDI